MKLDSKVILWQNEYYRVTGHNELKGEYTLVNLKDGSTSWEPIKAINEEAIDLAEERKRLCELLGLDEIEKERSDDWDSCMRQLYRFLFLVLAAERGKNVKK